MEYKNNKLFYSNSNKIELCRHLLTLFCSRTKSSLHDTLHNVINNSIKMNESHISYPISHF